jgi:ABC-type multidrug transport system fused ATPase/permease subunit
MAVGLVERVQNILMKPAAEWDVIEAEPATVQGLYTGYACILAAIPAVATMIQVAVFGHSPVLAVISGVIGYVLALVGLYLVAFIINALASSFGATANQIQAFKLATYANTAGWVAGAANIIPAVGGLISLVGAIYGLYLLYIGLPKLMKSPADKTTAYFIVTLVVAFVVYFVVAIVVGIITGIIAAMTIGAAAVTGAAATGGFH